MELLQKIVETGLKLVRPRHAAKYPVGLEEEEKDHVATYPIGLKEKVKDFETTVLLQKQSGRVQVVGITGMAGVGKTTLANTLFNENKSNFSKSYFLSEVREKAGRSLVSLQSELFFGLTQLPVQIDSVFQGRELLRGHLIFSQVLIVLDDVDNVDQVDALLAVNVLRSDSLILITSRDKDVLARSGVRESSIYKLPRLDAQQSRELFCSRAFCQPHPLPRFEFLVEKFLKACDGLPLSLVVLGSFLYGRSKKCDWEYQLRRLQRALPSEIEQRLRISYDSLNREDQQIFLNIATVFIGENRDTAIRTWNELGWQGSSGFLNLENKCIVEVDSENCIHMHNHYITLEAILRRDVSPGMAVGET